MQFDAIVVGAGAAGMMCAAQIGQKGMRVALVDHADKIGEKIRISGGGRCNFTNKVVTEANFASENPAFAKTALKSYRPDDFMKLMRSHGLSWTEKHKGQLFCDQKSQAVIDLLVDECKQGQVTWYQPCAVEAINFSDGQYRIKTNRGALQAKALVIATGGLPVPKIGATDFGLQIARQFGHRIVDTAPALVPLTFNTEEWKPYADLSGLAVPGLVRGSLKGAPEFDEDLLFTHRGLSGPGILQASTYWRPGQALSLNLSGHPTFESCLESLQQATVGAKAQTANWLATQLDHWPRRLLEVTLTLEEFAPHAQKKAAELGKKSLVPMAKRISQWQLLPSGTAGYAKAEVMRGGVATDGLNPNTLQSRSQAGLFFIGEVVDITGWLGGYNFQWAWASAVAAANGIAQINA